MQRASSTAIAGHRLLGFVQQSAPFSTFISAVNTGTLGFLKEKLATKPIGRQEGAAELYRNIFFNSDERSALRHVELTRDYIRLEFAQPNEEYRRHAGLLFVSEAERRAQGIPQWLVPVGLQNNEHCGGGATILLDKRNACASLFRDAGRVSSMRE